MKQIIYLKYVFNKYINILKNIYNYLNICI